MPRAGVRALSGPWPEGLPARIARPARDRERLGGPAAGAVDSVAASAVTGPRPFESTYPTAVIIGLQARCLK